ncbi:MAG TPA: hypothetical protein VM680_11895 [Verrucomicrobiae bacterium]|nr:hypothetical protein [Verrucomicrobiae bacterium]
MKTSGSAVWAFLLGSTSFGQGVITFYNDGLISADGEPYRAGVYRYERFDPSQPPGVVGAGDEYTAGLFLPSDLNNPLATTTFRSTVGTEVFAKAQDVVVPGVPPGSTANLVIRVWPTARGSVQNTITQGGQWGETSFTTRPLGGPTVAYSAPPIPPPGLGPFFSGLELAMPLGPSPTAPNLQAQAAPTVSQPTAALATSEQSAVTISVPLKPGYNFISNPLVAADNSIGALFKNIQGGIPSGTKVFKLVDGKFITALWSILDNKLIPDTVASETVLPGEGVLLVLPGKVDKVLTFSGEPQQGEVCTPIPPGFSIKANITPSDLNIAKSGVEFLPGDRVYVFNRATGFYEVFSYDELDQTWQPEIPTIPVGQSFFWLNRAPRTRTWCQYAIGALRQSGDQLNLNWTARSFAVESSTDLRNWTEVLPSGNTNTTIHTTSSNAFFRLRRQ